MRTPRVVLSEASNLIESEDGSKSVVLGVRDCHHLSRVLRRKLGDKVELIDPFRAVKHFAEIKVIDATHAVLEVLETFPSQGIGHSIISIVALVKPSASDEVVEKCVEAGATEIWFFRSARSQGKTTTSDFEKRLVRWNRIAEAAVKQSGGTIFPTIRCFENLAEALGNLQETTDASGQIRVVGTPIHANPTGQPANFFKLLSDKLPRSNSLQQSAQDVEIYTLVGPEGGLSSEELELARKHSFVEVWLGEKILRTETAACSMALLSGLFIKAAQEENN